MNLNESIISDIQSIINNAREKAVRSVDYERVVMYWNIGQVFLRKSNMAASERYMGND